MTLNVANIIRRTVVEGYGFRYCVWVQGCTRRCEGCANRHMWEIGAGDDMTVADIATDLMACNVDGLTLLGGEPFLQSEAVAELTALVKSMGKSVIVFTGMLYEEILSAENTFYNKILKNTDLLKVGEFQSSACSECQPFIGSDNQQFIFLNPTFRALLTQGSQKRRFEVRISRNGVVSINGMFNLGGITNMLNNIWG